MMARDHLMIALHIGIICVVLYPCPLSSGFRTQVTDYTEKSLRLISDRQVERQSEKDIVRAAHLISLFIETL